MVLVADHGYPYPRTLTYNEPLRHRIPMIWTGGAVAGAAGGDDLRFADRPGRDAARDSWGFRTPTSITARIFFAPAPPRKFAYYTFNDGFGVVDSLGAAVWDATGNQVVTATNPELLDVGRTMLQTTYTDIGRR